MTYLILITCYLVLFSYLSSKNLKWGLYLIAILLPTYLIRFSVLGIPATLLEGMIVILFIIWLIKEKISLNPIVWLKNIKEQKTKNKKQNAIPKLLRLPIILLLFASTISVFISPNFQSAAGLWKAYFIEPIMFLLVFVYNIKTTEEIKTVIRCLGIAALAIGIFAVIQKFTGALIPNPFWADEATRRITTFFGYPNANALFLAPILLLTLSNLIANLKLKLNHESWSMKHVAFDFLVVTLSLLTIIWTRSTGALIGLAAGVLALLLIYKKTRLITLLLILATTAIITFTPVAQNDLSQTLVKISQTHLPLNASDLHIRVQQWRETLKMLKDTPIFGAGLAGYQTLVAPYHINKHIEIYLYPHNFFLNFWSETGILGLLAIIWLIIIFFKLASKYTNILTFAGISAMIAILIYGLVDVPYFKNDLAILFWIIVGIIIVIKNSKHEILNPKQY